MANINLNYYMQNQNEYVLFHNVNYINFSSVVFTLQNIILFLYEIANQHLYLLGVPTLLVDTFRQMSELSGLCISICHSNPSVQFLLSSKSLPSRGYDLPRHTLDSSHLSPSLCLPGVPWVTAGCVFHHLPLFLKIILSWGKVIHDAYWNLQIHRLPHDFQDVPQVTI